MSEVATHGSGSNRIVLDKELNLLAGCAYSVTTTATPAVGSCGVQFVFKDANGDAVSRAIAGICYLSEASTGLTHNLADTSLAVLTNGALTNLGSAGPCLFTTTAAGLLGMTITAAADDYYLVFVLPGGRLLISDVCTVNSAG